MKPLSEDADSFKTVFWPILSPSAYAKGNVVFLFCGWAWLICSDNCLLSILSTTPNSDKEEYAFL